MNIKTQNAFVAQTPVALSNNTTFVRVGYRRRFQDNGVYVVKNEYITLAAFGELAEQMAELEKGDLITFEGDIRYNRWVNETTGEKKENVLLYVRSFFIQDGEAALGHVKKGAVGHDGLRAKTVLTMVGEPEARVFDDGNVVTTRRVLFKTHYVKKETVVHEEDDGSTTETEEWVDKWEKTYVTVSAWNEVGEELAEVPVGHRALCNTRFFEQNWKDENGAWRRTLGAAVSTIYKTEEVRGQF